MTDVVRKFTSPGQIVLDPCLDIIATEKAYLWLPSNCPFLGCKIDKACSENHFLEFWSYLRDKPSVESRTKLVENSDVYAAEKFLVLDIEGIGAANGDYCVVPRVDCVLHRLFLPALHISPATASEKAHEMRNWRQFRYQNGWRNDKGGSIQWAWPLYFLWTTEEPVRTWRSHEFDMGRMFFVF